MRFNPAQNWPLPPHAGAWRVVTLAVMSVLVALPRFGHTTPDSAYYIALVGYFKGQVGRGELVTPFAFRWVIPWLASWWPLVSPATALALCSLMAFAGSTLCLDRLLRKLAAPRAGAQRALFAFVLSFPALNYGGAVLTDSGGFLVLAAASCALIERRFLALGVVLAVGAGVRESTLIMLPAMVIWLVSARDGKGLVAAGAIVLSTLGAAWLSRWTFADLPAYGWRPSWDRLAENLSRPVSWATLLLTIVPVLLLALPGIGRWRQHPHGVRHFVLSLGLPGLALLGFSATAAFMSGRFAWPLYLVLAPLIAFRLPGRPRE